tara:strand:+ start:1529 stop:1822 length:294 start_codon:yes stop_codon:yes gene_type:complete
MKSRFGIPEEILREISKRNPGLIRSGIYIPTEKEVCELDPGILCHILVEWFYECPAELIPTDAQIEKVRSLLMNRPDADIKGVAELIVYCNELLKIS